MGRRYKKRRIPHKHKTTTEKGKREYMRIYMQRYRKEQKEKRRRH